MIYRKSMQFVTHLTHKKAFVHSRKTYKSMVCHSLTIDLAVKHDFSVWDYQNDGLHLNQTGKLKYAQHIRKKCDEILGSSGSAYTR